jgi:branched-chain amino acid transport system ATP-binding protein
MAALLQIKDLYVSYGGIAALQGVSLDIEKGAVVALIGANGAGKTTLLNAISAVVPKQSGKVLFNGEDITQQKPNVIMGKGIVQIPEGRKIFPEFTIEENLRIGAYVHYGKTAYIEEKLEMSYDLFPILGERRKQKGGTLSGGEQQMLALARGLMSDPEVLLLDEPSLGIAPIIVEKIFDLIQEINKMGKTIFLVEQNANMALAAASYAFVMETGLVTNRGQAASLLKDDSIRSAYLGV